jgi:protein gp37
MAKRLFAMGQPNYVKGFDISLHEKTLSAPFKWKKPSFIFVNSMSDLFHEKVPADFILKVIGIIRQTPQHQYQILTKRADRLAKLSSKIDWPKNLWMGVSIESDSYTYRIDFLKKTNAHIKFLSIEPLLGSIPQVDLCGIDWVIVGGESGPKSRPMKKEWVTEIRDQCLDANIPFFFKQWGGTNKRKTGRKLEGKTWSQMPPIMTSIS